MEHNISKQKLAVFLYTSSKQSKNEIEKTIPNIIASQRISLRKILAKEVHDSYTENYETQGFACVTENLAVPQSIQAKGRKIPILYWIVRKESTME